MAITFRGRICELFGYTKNAKLIAINQATEPQAGHVNWASHQNVSVAQNEIQTDIQIVLSKIDSIQKDLLNEVFGYMKNARLMMSTGKTEPQEGHVNWANGKDTNIVISEIKREAEILNDIKKFELIDLFPIKGHQRTELNSHRRMETNITISNNRRLDAFTKTWTADSLLGFHGQVKVYFLDIAGNILWNTENTHRYGVNPKSSRTDSWSEIIPEDCFSSLDSYSIIHTLNARPISPEDVGAWAKALEPIIKNKDT